MSTYQSVLTHLGKKKFISFPVKMLSDSSRRLVCSCGAQLFLVIPSKQRISIP